MDKSKRNVLLLSVSLSVTQVGTAIVAVVAALAGHYLAVDKSLSTLPLAFMFTATMAATIPASLFMGRVGRRVGFTVGQLFGVAGAALSTYALFDSNFWLFAAAGAVLGVHNAFWQYYRFAAAEVATPDFRSRAISYVVAGGVAAAVLGPELAKLSQPWFEPVLFAGCYAVIIVLNAAAISFLQYIDIPVPAASTAGSGRPLAVIFSQPSAIVAVLSAMIAYGTMMLVMTATPIAMIACGFGFAEAAFVIQWHAVGMFGPSFFTGHLIRRFGVLNIIAVGAVLNAICMAVNLAGIQIANFWIGLVFLGIGWNFMFVGGTALLTETYRPEERFKAQSFNDFLVFSTAALASFSAGAIQHWLGWQAVNAVVALPVLVGFTAAVWLRTRQGHARAA